MRKFVFAFLMLAIFSMFIVNVSFATTKDTYVSAGTTSFSSTGNFVTFNSVTNHIILWNDSVTDDCWVDIVCRDIWGNPLTTSGNGSVSSVTACIKLPYGSASATGSTSIHFDFSTKYLGFMSKDTSTLEGQRRQQGRVAYVVTGDKGSL